MPTIFIEGYKFRFYSSDIQEPPHVHVIHGDDVAKIWLVPVSLLPLMPVVWTTSEGEEDGLLQELRQASRRR